MAGAMSPDEVPTKKQGKYAAMATCWVLGIGSLVTWNCLFTAADYFSYLYPDYHPTRVLTFIYMPFLVGTIAILTYHEAAINTRRRNLIGYSMFFTCSLLLIVLNLATSGRGGILSFAGVCLISGAFGVADAYVNGGMVGDLSLMCPELVQSFMAGTATSGVVTSILRMITKGSFENSNNGLRKGALLFFSISAFLELLCLLLYAFIFPKLPITRFYHLKAASEGSKTVSADLVASGIRDLPFHDEDPERLKTKELFLQNIDYVVGIFLTFMLTFAIFPGFLSEDTGSHRLGSWYVLVLITMYNVWDLIGLYIPLLKPLKLTSRRGLMAATLSRFFFIPAFYFVAKHSGQGWMILLTSLLGFSDGYLTACIMMAAPKGYKGPEQNAIGNLLALFLSVGVLFGVTLSWLWLIGKGW